MTMRMAFARGIGLLLALAALPVCAQDWPQWRGPDRTGAADGSPPLLEAMPEAGLKILWQSEPIPDTGDVSRNGSDVGYSSPVAAGGKVFLYLNQRQQDTSPFTLGWGLRNRLGCFEPALPEALAQKVEAARTSPERQGLKPDEVPAWAGAWLAKNLTHEEYAAYALGLMNRLMCGAEALDLRVLERIVALKDKNFATPAEVDAALASAGLPPERVKAVVKELGSKRRRALDILFCFDAQTGKTLWKKEYPGELFEYGTSSTPCVVGDLIYVSGGRTIYCLKTADGSEVWQAPCPAKEVSSSPIVADGVLVIQAGSLCGLDAASGKLLWTRPEFKGVHASPTVWRKDGVCYAVHNGGLVEIKSGKLMWFVGGGRDSSPVVGDGCLVIDGLVCYKLGLEKPEPMWRLNGYGMNPSTPVIYKGLLFGSKAQSGPLFCVELATGKLLWTSPEKVNFGNAAFNTASSVVVDGKLFLDSNGGNILHIVRAQGERFEEIGSCKLVPGNLRSSTPTIADGRMFIRGKEALVCYDVGK